MGKFPNHIKLDGNKAAQFLKMIVEVNRMAIQLDGIQMTAFEYRGGKRDIITGELSDVKLEVCTDSIGKLHALCALITDAYRDLAEFVGVKQEEWEP